MRYLLDTNVISELVKPAPSPRVVAWVRAVSPLDLALSALTIGELEHGISRLADGRRRRALAHWLATDVTRQFHGRVLPVDAAVAAVWGRAAARAERAGTSLSVVDGLLVATATVHELTLVTRNVRDCAGHGAPLFDPWRGQSHAAD